MEYVRRWRGALSMLVRAACAVRNRDLGASARGLLGELGVGVVTGADRLSVPGARGTLVVANHVSWLDIVAALAVEPVAFLAKREIGRWPVIGGIARHAGTRFIGRNELRGLPRVVADLADTLRSGRSVMVFPEGTTWCGGHGGGVFRRAAFQAAIDANAQIRPVTFEYRQGEEPSTVAAFVGDDTLLTSLRRVARARDLRVTVTAHEPFSPSADRRALAARAEAEVRQVAHV